MPDTPLNPDALEAGAKAHHETYLIKETWSDLDVSTKAASIERMRIAVSAYIAVAQPEVNSVEELDALPEGSVVRGGESDLVGEKIRHSPYPPHWCTIGEEVEAYERDLLPARVLYRPTEETRDGR